MISPRSDVVVGSPSDIIRIGRGLEIGGLQGYGDNIALDLVYTLHNLGLSPAYNAVIKGRLRVTELLTGWANFSGNRKYFGDFFEGYYGHFGPTVLAQKKVSLSNEVFLYREDIQALDRVGATERVFLIDAVVMYPYNNTVGETGVTYLVTHKRGIAGGMFDHVDVIIPASDLCFTEIPELSYSK